MMNSHVDENKGQYCRFVLNNEGSYVLKPVKVPTHVIEERAAQIRKQEIQRHVNRNRMRAQSINGSSLLFMTVALVVFALVCCSFLGLQNSINNRVNTIASLQKQIEKLDEDNDVIEKRIASAEDITTIEEIATEKLGMRRADSSQVVFYDNDRLDYMLQYLDVSDIE